MAMCAVGATVGCCLPRTSRHQAIRTAGRAVRGTSVVAVPAVPANGREWGWAEQGGRWACGKGVRVGLVGACSNRSGRGGRGVQHRRRPQPGAAGAGRWPPRPVPGRSWTSAGDANELGAVPALVYHQVVAWPAGDYDQTPAQVHRAARAALRPSLPDDHRTALAAGQVDLPAGTSPMVLTVEDSTLSQYAERPPPQVFGLRREWSCVQPSRRPVCPTAATGE